MTFKPEVLNYSGQVQAQVEKDKRVAQFLTKLEEELEAGLPIHVVIDGLVKAGFQEREAYQALFAATKGRIKQCKRCHMVYSGALNYCSSCGERLTDLDPNK